MTGELTEQEIVEWFNEHKQEYNMRHPLHTILAQFDAYVLGRMLDSFSMYEKHKWEILKAVRDNAPELFPEGFDAEEFSMLVGYNRIMSDRRYVEVKCPDEYRDMLVK